MPASASARVQARAEDAEACLHLAKRATDGDRVALRLLALAEHVDGLGHAQPLLQRPLEIGPAHLALVGLDVELARQRRWRRPASERANGRARLAAAWGVVSSGLNCQYQPECVISNSGSPTSLGRPGSLDSP